MSASGRDLGRRRAALLAALSAREASDSVQRILTRHCDGEALLELYHGQPRDNLGTVLVEDLKDTYRRFAHALCKWDYSDAAAEQYWYRRFELTRLRLWSERSAGLPRYWRVLAVSEPVAFEQACIDVGAQMVGYAALLESSSAVARWLAPLGGRRARDVVDRFDSLARDPIGDDLANRWHYAYSRKVRLHKGKRIQFDLGLELLATAYQRLSADTRAVIEVVLDSSVRSALEQPAEGELLPAEREAEVERWLDRVLASPGVGIRKTT
ncbi:MAG: hypothetical protein ACE5HE_06445 [Phycisphaerae bacterium]